MPQPSQPASSCSNNHPPDRTSTKHQTLRPPPRQPETTHYRLKASNFHSEVSTTAKPIVRLTLPAIDLSTRPAPNPELTKFSPKKSTASPSASTSKPIKPPTELPNTKVTPRTARNTAPIPVTPLSGKGKEKADEYSDLDEEDEAEDDSTGLPWHWHESPSYLTINAGKI
ncbi:hypothetical protein PtA15_12A453 [Puccinia triticina]|uniref:Uncharacterized protein n=1 Tax=Puccinia triticina TaxID=208348 RepID=A0ABY7CYR3_9BASI|nr:uncharacterized protein PtA15_12A453 [Puccinia triticina]WAQ90464.1 hypothetical protein PtA15_12A453 [Puccinia triticina]